MITTKARKSLQDQDKVGMGETFEARIRGALSPFSMSISLLMEKLIKEPTNTTTLDFLLNMVKNQKHQLDKILELLIASEDDREELEMLILTDTLKDYEISEREHPNDSKRTKINFHTVNGGNYEIIPPQQIAETNARTNKSIKAMKEFKKRKTHIMKVNKIYESFRNNVMCRNDSTQHAANVLWNDLKNHLPIDKRKEFEIEWSHYMSGELNNDEFVAYIKELKQHLGHGY